MLIPEKYAIITGASSGLGKAFAENLTKEGYNLILISRNEKKLTELKSKLIEIKKINIKILVKDLLQKSSITEIENFLLQNNIKPDLLVNNAGMGLYGRFSILSLDKQIELVNLNVNSIICLTAALIKIMEQNSGGQILNIASTYAFRPSPNWTVYGATKSFIYSFTQSLNLEYIDSNIQLSALCPGKINTDFDGNAGFYSKNNRTGKEADKIAKMALKDLKKGKSIILPGIDNKIKCFIYKRLPNKITSLIFKKPGDK